MSVTFLGEKLTIVPYNGKIADITHADTNKHTLDLQAALSETREIVAIDVWARRMGGAGEIIGYSNEGTQANILASYAGGAYGSSVEIYMADGTNRLQYSLSVANDDFDLYCLGYTVKS